MPITGITIGGGASGGGTLVALPDVAGMTEAAAKAALDGFRITVRSVEAAGDAGEVLTQEPAAGSVRPRGSAVTIFVITNPVVPVNLGELLKTLQDTVDTLETDEAAAHRARTIIEHIDALRGGFPVIE